ncbi:MAG: type II secretion system protein GspL [Coxiellaceae bacterium]|nr:type II secretion system protein GspL [Coxiellaceae bacterium]
MFIFQQNTDQSGEWIETNASGDVIATRSLLNLSECPKIDAEDLLVILVPGQDVMVTAIDLPKVRAAERARIAPFAIEELLASDPESVYIAFGMMNVDGKTTVAVLNQPCFEKQYEDWIAKNLHPRIVTPDFLAIAWEPETWTIVLHRDMALVRTGLQAGFAIDAHNLLIFLKQYLEKNPLLHPKKISVWQGTMILSLHELDGYQIPIEMCDATDKNKWDVVGLLSQLNLLQGKYRPKIQASRLEKSWKIFGIVAVSWVIFLFLSQLTQWIYLRHEAVVLQTEVTRIYRTLFPGAATVLEPNFRTEALLKRYDQARHGRLFLKLYRAVGKTLLHYPDIHLQSFAFQEGAMQLTVSAPNVGLLTQWNNALLAEKISVKQTIGKAEETSVQAVVIVSSKGPSHV